MRPILRITAPFTAAFLILLSTRLVSTNPLPVPVPQAQPAPAPCAAITVISARGTTEDPGEGRLTTIASDLANAHENSERIALDYPAYLFPYSVSLFRGIQALTGLLNTSVSSCPTTKVVLLGYSQGAHVIGNTLCGGAFAEQGIDQRIGNKVAAIIFMADPRHVPGKSFNVGSSTKSGYPSVASSPKFEPMYKITLKLHLSCQLFPRPESENCDVYASRMRSYCDSGDPVCDSGFEQEVHRAVVEKYRADAVAFVNRLLFCIVP
ncbi:hypothetical protein ACJ72_05355 [Emergomyces africanus]|uniref:Cutinase n=1 Tax=Emergomyces africanus TaxID=1955775 RepID=A0A1B7NU78_9EURO|nr:hypothetical protein ACJ72_05355 [Emergomyces africanus]